MTKRMLIDATHAEETRVVVLDGNRLEDFDVETSAKQQLKGNIYLAKVVRVEPSLQAAFVEYGGGRHGFLAFGEIHPDYYQIPVADRQRLLAMQAEEARAEAEAEERDVLGAAPSLQHPGPLRPMPAPIEQPETDPIETNREANDIERIPAERPDDADPAPDAPTVSGDASAPAPADHAHSDAGLSEGGDPEEPRPNGRPAQAANMARDERFGPADADVAQTPIESLDIDPSEMTSEEPPKPITGTYDTEDADLREPEQADESFPDADLDVSPDDAPPPETIGGEPESSGSDDARRRRESRFLRNYRIQEVIRRRQIMLIQVVKEERGTKGAALTTYISLAGRFSVLMPNSPRGGGISRKITSAADRRRLKEVTAELDLPQGMGLIVRTAGANRPKPEIKRDCEYLMRLWDDIREHTLRSVAPALIYEEASLIKRAIRDVYSRDIDEIVVDGEPGWRSAHEFMRMLMPSHAKKVQLWRGEGGQPLFSKHQVEAQLDAMLSPTVQLKSGGYLVINQTEALVAIDVNSGRSTRERNIEETAFRTNLEAADEAARQLRLRDLAGLIVIDFIDMESRKNNAAVERRLKDALRVDRARIQVGTISHFGLLEMSRQRLRPSVTETSFVACPHCGGSGHVRSTESAAIHVLREIEDEAARGRFAVVMVHAASSLVMFLLNHKRDRLGEIETRTGMRVQFAMDDTLAPPACRIDKVRARTPEDRLPAPLPVAPMPAPAFEPFDDPAEAPDIEAETEAEAGDDEAETETADAPAASGAETAEEGERRRRRRRRRRGGRRDTPEGKPDESQSATSASPEFDDSDEAPTAAAPASSVPSLNVPDMNEGDTPDHATPVSEAAPAPVGDGAEMVTGELIPEAESGSAPDADGDATSARRRGRRGGRRRRREDGAEGAAPDEQPAVEQPVPVAAYTGPTPADPFGGSGFDIYDLLDTAPSASFTTPPPASVPPSAVVTAPAAEPEPAAADFEPTDVVAETPTAEAPAEPVIGAAVQPVLIGGTEAAGAPKRGWWRR